MIETGFDLTVLEEEIKMKVCIFLDKFIENLKGEYDWISYSSNSENVPLCISVYIRVPIDAKNKKELKAKAKEINEKIKKHLINEINVGQNNLNQF